MSTNENGACKTFIADDYRKRCANCTKTKEFHQSEESTVKDIVNILSRFAKNYMRAADEDNDYDWIPPNCPKQRLDEYFKKIPNEEIPIKDTVGAEKRKELYIKQIPLSDISANHCKYAADEFKKTLSSHIDKMQNSHIHFGYVKAWESALFSQCPSCLVLFEPNELVIRSSNNRHTVFHPACFRCGQCEEQPVDLIHCMDENDRVFCIRHYSETLRKRCHVCDEIIFSSQYAQAEDLFFHKEHLECFGCRNIFENNQGIVKDGEMYCSKCYENLLRDCENCGKKVELGKRHVTYKDKFWHFDCCTCDECEAALTVFQMHNGRYYCPKCYKNHHAPRCGKCDDVFGSEGKTIKYQAKMYHPNCFRCADCEESINEGSFIPREDQVYCKSCYFRKFGVRCFKCHTTITDDLGIVFNKHPYHAACFICDHCQTQLANKECQDVDGKIICESCFNERFSKLCNSCGKPIEIDENDAMLSHEDYHWHEDCFNCEICEKPIGNEPFTLKGSKPICKDC